MDERILSHPKDIEEIAPVVGNLAARYFAEEMGYAPSEFDGKMVFQRQEEFLRGANDIGGCTHLSFAPNSAGYSHFSSDKTFYNLDMFLRRERVRNQPAGFIFYNVVYELHHARPPAVKLREPLLKSDHEIGASVEGTTGRGLAVYVPDHPRSSPGRVCFSGHYRQAEETVVEDSAQRMISKVGIPIENADYGRLVQAYRNQVLNPYFGGEHRSLLRLQQASDRKGFYRITGEKLGYSSERQVEEGANFLNGMLARLTV